METTQIKTQENPPHKTHKGVLIGQAAVRTLGIASALIAILLMITSKQTIEIFGVQIDAKYSYSPSFKYFVAVEAVACVLSVLSLIVFFHCVRLTNLDRKKYFIIFLTDLIVVVFALTGCSAASAIGYLGRYGNSHTGWMPICDNLGKFCNRVMASLISSYVAAFLFVVLTAWSAWESGRAQMSTY